MKNRRLHVSPEFFTPGGITFPEEAAHYLRDVLRLRHDDYVEVFDGIQEYLVRLTRCGDEVTGEVVYSRKPSPTTELEITLAFGCVRPGPFEEILRHCTELGVTRFVPLLTRRTERRPERSKSRWHAIMASAAAQSGRTRLPVVEHPVALQDFLAGESHSAIRVLFCRTETARMLPAVIQLHESNQVTLIVGPEGGLDELEEAAIIRAGFVPVRLGPAVLRTETAAVAAVGFIVAWHEWIQSVPDLFEPR